MKTFKQYINEIFNNPYDYNMYEFYLGDARAYFFTDDKKLFSVRIAERYSLEGNPTEVGFSAHPDYESDMSFGMNLTSPFTEDDNIDYIRISGIDEKLDIDTKDVSRIFATVIKITEKYYDKFKPDTLMFRAKNSEANRVTLYNKIAKRFAKKYNLELVTRTLTDSTVFALNKG